MRIVIDSCSVILLAKATILEKLLDNYNVVMTEYVYKEVMKGKDKMFEDALLLERLEKEKRINIINVNIKLMEKLINNFNLGKGEASTIAFGIKDKESIVATDNLQGRKAAKINNIPLVGSIEIIVKLFRKGKISHEKAIASLKILKEEGWLDTYLIERAMEDLK